MEGFRNDQGGVGVLLFRESGGFPGDTEQAYRVYYSTLEAADHSMEFADVEFGTYAVTAFHDENMNRRLDTGWFGVPREGVGVSGRVRGIFGPRFGDSAFSVEKPTVAVNIEIKYLR